MMLDHKICWFWMKVTGHGRRSYMAILSIIVWAAMVATDLIIARADWVWIFDLCIAPLFMWYYFKYSRWLRSPEEGLSTIKISTVYYDIRGVSSYMFLTGFILITSTIFIGTVFFAPLQFFLTTICKFLFIFYFCVKSQSGPPQPDNTFWQQAKSKLKSLLDNNRVPQLVPLPVRI